MITPKPAYPINKAETPTDALDVPRDLFERDPLAVNEGSETLASRTGAPAWTVEVSLEALGLDGGEIAA